MLDDDGRRQWIYEQPGQLGRVAFIPQPNSPTTSSTAIWCSVTHSVSRATCRRDRLLVVTKDTGLDDATPGGGLRPSRGISTRIVPEGVRVAGTEAVRRGTIARRSRRALPRALPTPTTSSQYTGTSVRLELMILLGAVRNPWRLTVDPPLLHPRRAAGLLGCGRSRRPRCTCLDRALLPEDTGAWLRGRASPIGREDQMSEWRLGEQPYNNPLLQRSLRCSSLGACSALPRSLPGRTLPDGTVPGEFELLRSPWPGPTKPRLPVARAPRRPGWRLR